MSKFKIGDKIVCIETDSETLTANDITYGKEYLVQGTDGDGVDIITDTDEIQYVYNFRFKLAEEKEMEQTAEQIRNEILRIDVRIEEAKKDIENAENERNSLVEKLREKGFVLVLPNGAKNISSLDEIVIGKAYLVTNNYGSAERESEGKTMIIKDIDPGSVDLSVLAETKDGSYSDWMHYQDLSEI